MDAVRAMLKTNIDKVQAALDIMHKDASDRVSNDRKRQIIAHNRKTNIVSPNFTNGDFVLVRRAVDKGHKLSNRWLGPRKITRVNRRFSIRGLET